MRSANISYRPRTRRPRTRVAREKADVKNQKVTIDDMGGEKARPPATTDTTVPIIYTKAVQALAECRDIDEANTFNNAAEALAAWAKIYKDDVAGREARQLKLHAYRRMGKLARQLYPNRGKKGGGRRPGPVAKLQEHGLSRHGANAANHLAKMGETDFETVVGQDRPPAPTSVERRIRQPGQLTKWKALQQKERTPFAAVTFTRTNDPTALAGSLDRDDVHAARQSTEALIRWLTAFNRALPKN